MIFQKIVVKEERLFLKVLIIKKGSSCMMKTTYGVVYGLSYCVCWGMICFFADTQSPSDVTDRPTQVDQVKKLAQSSKSELQTFAIMPSMSR